MGWEEVGPCGSWGLGEGDLQSLSHELGSLPDLRLWLSGHVVNGRHLGFAVRQL